MLLRKALPADVVDLKNICVDAYSKNFYHHWNKGGLKWYLDKEFCIGQLTSDLLHTNTEYYIIERELKSVGFIKMKINVLIDSQIENSSELEKIYILPSSKGMGLGKFALNEIIKISTKRGIRNLYLSVIDTNLEAISFYEKLGFKFESKTRLDLPYFKEELKGMHRLIKELH